MSAEACCVCGRVADCSLNERGTYRVELRPYGPGGAPICYDCGRAPDRAAETKARLGTAVSDALRAAGPSGAVRLAVGAPPMVVSSTRRKS